MKSLWFDWHWWPMEALTNVSSPFRLARQWQLLLQVLHSLVSVGLKCEHFHGFFHRRHSFWLHFRNCYIRCMASIHVYRLSYDAVDHRWKALWENGGNWAFWEFVFGSVWAPGLTFRGYANENSPVMVLINSSTTGPFKAVQELQKQETLIHDIINSSFFVFLISSSELFVFIPSQLLFSSTTLHCVLWWCVLFSYAL